MHSHFQKQRYSALHAPTLIMSIMMGVLNNSPAYAQNTPSDIIIGTIKLDADTVQPMACIPVTGQALPEQDQQDLPMQLIKDIELTLKSETAIGAMLVQSGIDTGLRQCATPSLISATGDPAGVYFPQPNMLVMSMESYDSYQNSFPDPLLAYAIFSYNLTEEYFHAWQYEQDPDLTAGAYDPLSALGRDRGLEIQAKLSSLLITATLYGSGLISDMATLRAGNKTNIDLFMAEQLVTCSATDNTSTLSITPDCLRDTFTRAMLFEDEYYPTSAEADQSSARVINSQRFADFFGVIPNLNIQYLNQHDAQHIITTLSQRAPAP